MSCSEIVQHARSFSPELGWAVEAAAAAGKIIKESVCQLQPFEHKGIGDLVSEVDRQADEIVTQTLRKYSQVPILSEELSPDTGKQSDLWIVDPLDATNAYLMRAGDHYPAVIIARQQGGKTQLGVVHFPLTGEWFYAQEGCCAWKNGQRLKTRKLPPATLADSWVEMNQYGDAELETPEFCAAATRVAVESGCQPCYRDRSQLRSRLANRRIKYPAGCSNPRQPDRPRKTGRLGHRCSPVDFARSWRCVRQSRG